MLYAIAVVQKDDEPPLPTRYLALPEVTIVRVETDGRRNAKRIGQGKARVEEGISKPKVVGVRLISRIGCGN
jgi:hypothetical protein